MTSLPAAAAERIVRNPHSIPRIPAALSTVIAYNRHQEHLCELADQAYLRRRSRIDNQRLERISRDRASANDSAVMDSDDESIDTLNSINAGIHFNGQPTLRRQSRRRSIVTATQRFRSASCPEAELAWSFALPAHERRSFAKSTYPPDLASLFMHRQAPNRSLNPIDRLRRRCSEVKSSRPFMSTHSLSIDSCTYPAWHIRLRQEYRRAGEEDVWRHERAELMRQSRRARQFQEQTRRRFSSS